MLFFFFLFLFFTKLDQMSRVGSRGRHPKCRPKKDCLKVFTNTFVNQSFCIGYYEQLKSPYLIFFPMMMCLSWLNSDWNFVSMKFVNLPSTLHCSTYFYIHH